MIPVEQLKLLRQKTSVSFTLCKKALEQSRGDIEEAIKILQKWGIEKAESKLSRATKQGGMFSYIHHNKKVGILLELLCETDFVAKTADFEQLGHEIALHIASMNPNGKEELLGQPYIKDPQKTIETLLKEYILKIGENIAVGRFTRFEL